jgi:hypothetical protein
MGMGFAKRGTGHRLLPVLLLTVWLCPTTPAIAGHESPYYPSFYPQEIRIETKEPATAAALLRDGSLHAYLGTDPFAGGPPPPHVADVESLGSHVILTFNASSPRFQEQQVRCAAGDEIRKSLAGQGRALVFHPYPVTPYHPDYLHHFDRAQAAADPGVGASGKAPGPGRAAVTLRAQGKLAEVLAGSGWRLVDAGWDAAVEEVDVAALLAAGGGGLNGWLGPPWLKEGWFHAYRLLGETVYDPARRKNADGIFGRLVTGAYAGRAEKLDLERRLVALLTQGCERVVLGYGRKRAWVNSEFSQGIENIGYDAQLGLISPLFFRTVKLKDFPWNGWLRIATEAMPSAAWNPVAGFSDAFGRLVWQAVGDPALLPAPHSASWIPNRVALPARPPAADSARVRIPRDALVPEAGSGLLRKARDGGVAGRRVSYRVPLSLFHDGTRMGLADLLYPFVFAYRWGGQAGIRYDPAVDRWSAPLRDRVAAIRYVGTDQEVKKFGPDLEFTWQVATIEMYLTSIGLEHAAALAPPWGTAPWHLLVLMEEAVGRGLAAFSSEEAGRRGTPWLDLVRNAALGDRLASLAEELEGRSFIPDALKGFVRPDQARDRWSALRTHHRNHGHFLVTNGPYRLESWSDTSAVLQVFRDVSYPLGVGAFDQYVLPPKARISRVERGPRGLKLAAELEKAVRAQRSTIMVREPLRRESTADPYPVLPSCEYVVVRGDGRVVRAGAGSQARDGTFRVDLRGLPSGRYTLLVAVWVNDNRTNPDIRLLDYRVGR